MTTTRTVVSETTVRETVREIGESEDTRWMRTTTVFLLNGKGPFVQVAVRRNGQLVQSSCDAVRA